MNTRLLYIIEKKIAHTRPLTGTKRTIEFYKFKDGRIESFELVINLDNPRVLALRHEVRRIVSKGWRIK